MDFKLLVRAFPLTPCVFSKNTHLVPHALTYETSTAELSGTNPNPEHEQLDWSCFDEQTIRLAIPDWLSQEVEQYVLLLHSPKSQ